MIKKYILLVLCILMRTAGFCQTGFERVYSSLYDDGNPQEMVLTSDQQFYVVNSVYAQQFYLAGGVSKLDTTGHLLWTKIYQVDSCNVVPQAILSMQDGNYLVTARLECGMYTNQTSTVILKIDPLGNILWSRKTYNIKNSPSAITALKDGNYVIGGYVRDDVYFGCFAFIKIDPNGNVIWSKKYSYGQYLNMYLNGITSTSDGGLAAIGFIEGFVNTHDDIVVLKIDRQGDLEWGKRYATTNEDFGHCICETQDKGFIMGANAVIKTDSLGNITWTRGCSDISSIYIGKGGAYYTLGGGWGSGGQTYFFKVSGNGILDWVQRYSTSGTGGSSVYGTKDGGFLLAGQYNNAQLYLIKTDSLGQSGCNMSGYTSNTAAPVYYSVSTFTPIATYYDSLGPTTLAVSAFNAESSDPCCTQKLHVTTFGDYFLCENTSVQLNVSGAPRYLWNTGDTTDQITVIANSSNQLFYVTGTNSCKSETDTIKVPIDTTCYNTSNVTSYGKDSSFLMPNPTTEYFKLYTTKEIAKRVRILDAFGSCIYSGDLQSRETWFDASLWAPGVYFIEVSDGRSKDILKLIR